jgi:hypothetical protein
MRYFPEILMPSQANCKLLMTRLQTRKMAAIALVSLTCSTTIGLTGCNTNNLGNQDLFGGIPSKGAVFGMAFGIGGGVAAVAIAVNHSHHTVKGCILSGPNGLEVQEDSNSTFELTGLTANVKAGDRYRLHGSKLKKAKHATGNRTFVVEKVGKDFGPCPVKPQTTEDNASYR